MTTRWVRRLGRAVGRYTYIGRLFDFLGRGLRWVMAQQLPDLTPQDRGDERSPTYAWDGITTTSGQGLTIPVVLGRHGVGGHVIYSDVFASVSTGTPVELLRVVLFLSEGPIYRIGDQLARIADGLGGFAGQAAGPPIPAGLRLNGTLLDHTQALPGARVWLRPGTTGQTALPTNPFRGASATLAVQQQLADAGEERVFTIVSDDQLTDIGFVFSAPGGLYQQDTQGNRTAYPVAVNLAWRPEGLGAWRSFYDQGVQVPGRTFGATPSIGAFAESATYSLQPFGSPTKGPIEVRVSRITAAGSSSSVISSLTWRQVSTLVLQSFAYPLSALIGLEIPANARTAGGTPQFLVPVDGVTVRVWDEVHGFSPPCWDVAAAPWDFSAHPPGRNPAWLLGEVLTNRRWGLGTYLRDDQIDWAALRRWAAFCDSDPNPTSPWGEAAFCFDGVIDWSRSAWDWVLAICSAGRATPIWIGGKFSVVYRYRDEHGDGGITVPAKAPVQLITAGNCTDVRVRWMSRGKRPTAFQFQFLNEDKLWAQDVLNEEDQEAPAIEDPTDPDANAWRPETVQAFGATRVSQLQREAVFMHRTNRLVRRELSFECGPWMLHAQKGDLIDFQHELLRPFDDVENGDAMQVLVGGAAVTEITIDHVVTGSGLAFVGRGTNGAPIHRNVTAAIAATHRGKPATRLQFSGAIDLLAGSPVVVGLQDQLVETYEIEAIDLTDKVRRRVRARQWVPEVYDPVDPPGASTAAAAPALEQPAAVEVAPVAADVLVVPLGGLHRIVWHRPDGARAFARARVFAREPGAAWALVDETARTEIQVDWFAPWRSYQVSVVTEDLAGSFGPPESGVSATIVAEEFPAWSPPAPTNLHALQAPDENLLVLRWDLSDQRDLDYYEVRSGSDWAAGVPVYRGRLAEARLVPVPAAGVLQVAARSTSGLYGPRAIVAFTAEGLPWPGAAMVDSVGYVPTGSGVGTHDGTEVDATTEPAAPFLALEADALVGTFTSDEIDLGTEAARFLRLAIDLQELDGLTVGEATFGAGSGEARWRTVGARPASAGRPGLDWSTLVGDLGTTTIEDLPSDLLVGGSRGEVGSHVQVLVESRTYAGGSWGAWADHVDRVATCSRWQARVVLRRRTGTRAIRVRTFTMETIA